MRHAKTPTGFEGGACEGRRLHGRWIDWEFMCIRCHEKLKVLRRVGTGYGACPDSHGRCTYWERDLIPGNIWEHFRRVYEAQLNLGFVRRCIMHQ